ncbi:unnamed protein product [Hyaloperonospora brassicae]|uniref:Uncharacterized protein n=1 Tax=Hyaloperonospora brassicae TaxID=162125 RepID=A0AAV0US78_HYABA|nr:unnamed protein product [Hyaloperonospora brassicae]
MATRSYAGPEWLLFIRTDSDRDGIVVTAVSTRGKNVVAERMVDETALMEHSEEIGVEMEPIEFRPLLLKTLETRRNVDLSVRMRAESETVEEVHLLLTYAFSSDIRRKGAFRLSIVAADAPVSLVALLTSIHATPPRPILSEDEQREKVATELPSSASKSSDAVGPEKAEDGNMRDSGEATAFHRASSSTATAASIRPVRLQKRLHPAGTMRRKGPRGAKLAKK